MAWRIKKFIFNALKKMPLALLPLDEIFYLSQKFNAYLAHILYIFDWPLERSGRPQFFKHQINIAKWPFEPHQWAFTARGVYSRENMFKGCKVLDLCCGDGAYSYLFFSDIAGSIDAVDKDPGAIKYAKKYFKNQVITYYERDILSENFPSSKYDFIIWNAAICYFTEQQNSLILSKIIRSGNSCMQLVGMLPKANGWIDHKTEFFDKAQVDTLLSKHFKNVLIREVDEGTGTTFYFQASSPC